MTGHYDRQAEAARLDKAIARAARDPFAGIPADPEPPGPDYCGCCGGLASEPPKGEHGDCCRNLHDAGPAPEPATEVPAADPFAGIPCTCDHPPGESCETSSCAVHNPPEPAAAAPVLWNAEWPYPELTPADTAALFTTAAEIITARGYYADEALGYADKPGVSVSGALKAAALERAQFADPQGDRQYHYREAQDVAEDLETRLAGVLYMLGLLHTRTGIRDLADQVTRWEQGHYTLSRDPGQAQAVALLKRAADLFSRVSDDTAPVTQAPGPGRD